MKRFKLIKEYPNSPKMPFGVVKRDDGKYQDVNQDIRGIIRLYNKREIENNPEYWEEIKSKHKYKVVICELDGTEKCNFISNELEISGINSNCPIMDCSGFKITVSDLKKNTKYQFETDYINFSNEERE